MKLYNVTQIVNNKSYVGVVLVASDNQIVMFNDKLLIQNDLKELSQKVRGLSI